MKMVKRAGPVDVFRGAGERRDPPVEALAQLGQHEWPAGIALAQAGQGVIEGIGGHEILRICC
ncbi:MAG: hypothetical protein ACLFU3_09695 [Dichotomicrobium sp.]